MADQDNQQVREKETVVVDSARDNRGNNGVVIGVIVAIVVVLLLIFVVNMGGDEASPDTGGTDVNVETPAPTGDTGSN